jgi:hypothetical protein
MHYRTQILIRQPIPNTTRLCITRATSKSSFYCHPSLHSHRQPAHTHLRLLCLLHEHNPIQETQILFVDLKHKSFYFSGSYKA